MRKLLALVAAGVLAALLLVGCGSSLPEGFDEEKINEVGNEAVEYMNAQAFDKLVPLFAPDKQAELSVALFEEKFGALLDGLGAYQSADQAQVIGHTDEETGETFAVAQTMLTYENGQLHHALWFNKESQLVSYQLGIVEDEA